MTLQLEVAAGAAQFFSNCFQFRPADFKTGNPQQRVIILFHIVFGNRRNVSENMPVCRPKDNNGSGRRQ